MQQQKTHVHLDGVDVLRSVAVLMVLAFHFGVSRVSGPMGVSIFFVLSGFLITGLLLKEFAARGDISFRNFYYRRSLRIFPAFYVCAAASLILLLIHHVPFQWPEVVGAFGYATDYIRAFAPAQRQTDVFYWISWSLAIEEQFYLLWPLVLLFLLRRGWNVARLLFGVIVILWVYRAAGLLSGLATSIYVYNAFEMRLDGLMVGSLLAVLHARRVLPKITLWTAVACGAALVALSFYQSPSSAFFLTWLTATPVITALLVVFTSQGGALTFSSWTPAFSFLAALSYSLYLWHFVVIDETGRTLQHGRTLTGIVATFVLAALSYYFVERPALRWRDRKRNPSVRAVGEPVNSSQ